MNEPNRPLWQIILAAAVLFGFFVLLTVIRTSKTDTTPEPTPTPAESPIAEEPAHTPAPTPTESTGRTCRNHRTRRERRAILQRLHRLGI